MWVQSYSDFQTTLSTLWHSESKTNSWKLHWEKGAQGYWGDRNLQGRRKGPTQKRKILMDFPLKKMYEIIDLNGKKKCSGSKKQKWKDFIKKLNTEYRLFRNYDFGLELL